jgi:2'-5' RNA ligase
MLKRSISAGKKRYSTLITRMRLFTAIDIPVDVRCRLETLLDRLRPAAKLSWSSADKLHITTKFIGEWPQDRLEELKRTLQAVTLPGGIKIAIHKPGWFPDARRPRVLFVGVEGGRELKSLGDYTQQAVSRIGVPSEDREYTPHLTLARIRKPVSLEALRRVVETLESEDFGSFTASAFSLYLSRAGQYTRLAEFSLN